MIKTQAKLNIAARALANAGFVHAYGHASIRLDEDRFLVCAAKPMGLITDADKGTTVPVIGDLPDGVLGEVRIHQQIYKHRPDVQSVCRTMPPHVMALAALGRTAKPRHGFGTYFSPELPLWPDIQLIRSDEQAEGIAEQVGDGKAIMMQGNGLITAGASIEHAVVWAWYANDMARVELEHLRTGLDNPVISPEACTARATEKGLIIERMWDFLTTPAA
ncbi:MAG: class II aldolase/adducin family protein [Kordiimonadaceae bacterium]|nr:class II aldolase/adducin family protein [Kordiimonadaceae bacterium]